MIGRIQAIADRNIERFGLVDDDTASPELPDEQPSGHRLPADEAAQSARMAAEETGASRLSEETTQGPSKAGPELLRLPEDEVERRARRAPDREEE